MATGVLALSIERSHSPIGRIYLITNLWNGKQYVGQTRRSVARRWSQHLFNARSGSRSALHRAIAKYGRAAFSISEVAAVVGHRQDLLTVERQVILQWGTVAPNGYNLSEGGEGVDFDNAEIRASHRAAMRFDQAWRDNISASAKTRPIEVRNAQAQRMREWCASEAGRAVRAANVVKALNKRLANMRERDALRTPDELARIERKRESVRRCAAKRKKELSDVA